MNASDVMLYLREHPEFFEDNIDMLSTIKVRHPHGQHAIPLVERQMLALRDKSRKLEGTLADLINFGEQNDVTSERMHKMTLAMLAAPNMFALLKTIDTHLQEDFGLDASAVRLWGGDAGALFAEFENVSDEAKTFGDSLTLPHLSAEPIYDTAEWFAGKAPELASFAYVPLRAEQSYGLLVFASKNPARFTPDMGTLYIQRLGELVSMALRRFLEF